MVELIDLVVGGLLARLLRWVALARLHPNFNRITHNIWVGGANHPQVIVSRGFNAVLDLRMKNCTRYRTCLENSGTDYMNIKIPDGHGSSPKTLLRIVEWLVERVRREEKVLVHCSLGRGRAALATAAYLVFEGATPEEAMKKLEERRLVTFLNARQREALQEFSNAVA